MRDQYKPTLLSGTQKILALYDHAGFNVVSIHADGQFQPLENDLKPVQLNCCAAKEHVLEIEGSVQTSKEALRKLIHGLPFQYYPRILIEEMVKYTNSWLNAFPAKHGISNTLSPRTIITGRHTDYETECRVEFGTYCLVYDKPKKTNTTDGRSRECLALGPAGNRQGSYLFLDLHTWEKVSRNTWNELPMPEHIILLIHQKAQNEGRQKIKNADFVYEWDPGSLMEDHADDAESDSEDDSSLSQPGSDDGAPTKKPATVPNTSDVPVYSNTPTSPNDNDNDNDVDSDNDDSSIHSESDDDRTVFSHDEMQELDSAPSVDVDAPTTQEPSTTTPASKPTSSDIPSTQHDLAQHPSPSLPTSPLSSPPASQSRYNLRQRSTATQYSFLQLSNTPSVEAHHAAVNKILHHVFMQVPHLANQSGIDTQRGPTNTDLFLNQAVRVFGQHAVDTIIKEAKQLNDTKTITPVYAHTLSRQQKLDALRALTFVKRKRSGHYKGRTCADGRKQRSYISKQYSTSPTISLEGLIISCCIDALECRNVATCDIQGAYLNSAMDDLVYMCFTGQMVDFVVMSNPEYSEFIEHKNGQKRLYMHVTKALYGCLHSAILWYTMLSEFFVDQGFTINPYEPCIANKTIDGTQFTICWFVDDLKLSHVNEKVVDKMIKTIEAQFGVMTVQGGNRHTYVGMNLEFLPNGQVKIDQKEHLDECVTEFETVDGILKTTVATPAMRKLMEVRSSPSLSNDQAAAFHSLSMKLFWASKRSRPDIEPALAFLATRCTCSTEADWAKLKRVMQFVKGTRDDVRVLAADGSGSLQTWIDVSYAVHADMKSHTGACISMGEGIIFNASSKQKLNVKSSTEGEVVGASDRLPQTIWTQNFLKHQGYDIKKSTLWQDNTSAIKIEKNGWKSCGQKSRHIIIHYFFC